MKNNLTKILFLSLFAVINVEASQLSWPEQETDEIGLDVERETQGMGARQKTEINFSDASEESKKDEEAAKMVIDEITRQCARTEANEVENGFLTPEETQMYFEAQRREAAKKELDPQQLIMKTRDKLVEKRRKPCESQEEKAKQAEEAKQAADALEARRKTAIGGYYVACQKQQTQLSESLARPVFSKSICSRTKASLDARNREALKRMFPHVHSDESMDLKEVIPESAEFSDYC
jgi:hypothetical protein